MSNSSTGGYLSPDKPTLNFEQFIQTVIVGISGIQGQLVRKKWQPNPPKQPDANTNWIAFGIASESVDNNAFVGMDGAGVTTLQRQEYFELQCSVYGPAAYDTATILRDGFQIQQNLAALKASKMGFIGDVNLTHSPDLVNEVWIDRYEMTIKMVRLIQRTYSILPLIGAKGKIFVVLPDGKNTIDWLV
jgi:hypothetical protein